MYNWPPIGWCVRDPSFSDKVALYENYEGDNTMHLTMDPNAMHGQAIFLSAKKTPTIY